MSKKTIFFLILIFSMHTISSLAQNERSKRRKNKIELIQTDGSLEKVKINGETYQKITGPNIVFRQGTTYYYCEEALYNKKKNILEAIGGIRIKDSTLTITGKKLIFDGNSKIAQIRQNVVLTNATMKLYTEYLDYNIGDNTANYFNGGKIIDDKSTLTSKKGFIDQDNNYVLFTDSVVAINPEFKILTNNLKYHLITKDATCTGPTRIINEKGEETYTTYINYNTKSKVTNLDKGSRIEGTEYQFFGDKIVYDDQKKITRAEKNVRLVSKKENVVVEGDFGLNDKKKGITKMHGNILMLNPMEQDTLYITADTLVAIDSDDPKEKRLLAYHHVKMYKADLKGKCDSLVYHSSDSTIHFYGNPIMWSEKNQIVSDSMYAELKNNKLDKIHFRLNALIISEDTVKNFNQLKGKNMTAFFNKGKINRVNVYGNGESIYFAVEGDSLTVGMNRVKCSNMLIGFTDKGKIQKISFLNTPDGNFIPPHELAEPQKKLKGFKWRVEEQPTKKEVVGKRRKMV